MARIPAWHAARGTSSGTHLPGRRQQPGTGAPARGAFGGRNARVGGDAAVRAYGEQGLNAAFWSLSVAQTDAQTIRSVGYWFPCPSPRCIPQAGGLQPPSRTLRAAGEGGSRSADQLLSLPSGAGHFVRGQAELPANLRVPPAGPEGERGRCDLVFSDLSEVVIEKRPIDRPPCPPRDRTGRNRINLQEGRSRLDIWE